jgi:hypothetical protein
MLCDQKRLTSASIGSSRSSFVSTCTSLCRIETSFYVDRVVLSYIYGQRTTR